MTPRLLTALFIMLLPTVTVLGNNEPGAIKGTVTTSDNKPAPAVTIQLKGTKKIIVTNESGEFRFNSLSPGEYVIELSYVGYSSISKTVTVLSNETATVHFSLDESAAQLTEVVVSANRKSYIAAKPSVSLRLNADLIEVPQNITVATKQSLMDMGLLSKTEIYRLSSGITKSFGGAMDMTVQIRGTNSTYNTYRNGIGGPIWWNAQEDAAMIEKLEFVKGPAGFMLANAEPGGLINTVTKQPIHQQIAEITFAAGSWNMMRTAIDLGGEFKKEGKLTYRLNAGAQKNNEYYKFGEFNRFFVAPVLKYDFSDHTSLTIEHNYVKARAQENTHTSISANGNIWALPVNIAINDPNNDPWQAEDIYNRAYLSHQFNDNWRFNAQAAYMVTTWGGTTLVLEGISEDKDTLFRAANYNDWYGRLTNMQMFLDGKFYTGSRAEHKVLIGIDYGDGMETSTNGGTWGEYKYPLSIAEPTYYLPKDSLKFTGELYTWMARNRWQALYVQDHLKLFDKVIVTLAGRFTKLTTGQDWNSPPDDPEYELAENKFTPRIGLTYMFTKNISAYILHDESFLSQRGAIFGGGRLPPLTGRNNEAGVKALFFNQQLSVAASVYDIIKNNVGNEDPLHAGFYLRTGQVRSRGVELDVAGKINTNLYINANYSYSDAKITQDEDKTLIGLQNNGTARNLANAWVKYQVNSGVLKGIGIGGGLQHTGQRSAVWPGYNSSEGNKYLPAYTIFDASVSYATSRFYIGLNVFNITNKRYATSGNYEPFLQEYLFDIEPPVNFRLSTTIKL